MTVKIDQKRPLTRCWKQISQGQKNTYKQTFVILASTCTTLSVRIPVKKQVIKIYVTTTFKSSALSPLSTSYRYIIYFYTRPLNAVSAHSNHPDSSKSHNSPINIEWHNFEFPVFSIVPGINENLLTLIQSVFVKANDAEMSTMSLDAVVVVFHRHLLIAPYCNASHYKIILKQKAIGRRQNRSLWYRNGRHRNGIGTASERHRNSTEERYRKHSLPILVYTILNTGNSKSCHSIINIGEFVRVLVLILW